MKVITQLGLLDINPAEVVSIRPAPVLPDNIDHCDLTYCVEFDGRFYSLDDHVVCISESDAEKLAELAGIEIEGRRKLQQPQSNVPKELGRKTIFVPFKKLLVLNEWEKHFASTIAWKKGVKSEPVTKPAPSSSFSDERTLYEENHQPISLIEQVFRAQGL